MADNKRGKRAGKRGNDFRPSKGYATLDKLEGPRASKGSTSALLVGIAPYYECAEVEENHEDHIIPRRSLTRQQGLALFPQHRETVDQTCKVIDQRSGTLVTITNPVTVWRSDRTLLRRNKPERLEDLRVIRETSRTKKKIVEREEPAVIEAPILFEDSDL